MSALDAALIAAHAQGDKAKLVALYSDAAKAAPSEDERAFFLTHAYVFALEIDAPETPDLRMALAQMGREIP